MENETKNTTLENFAPTETDLDFKPDTSIPDTEPEDELGPGAEPEPEDVPGPGAKTGAEQEETEEKQDKGQSEPEEEPEEDPIKVLLTNYEPSENQSSSRGGLL